MPKFCLLKNDRFASVDGADELVLTHRSSRLRLLASGPPPVVFELDGKQMPVRIHRFAWVVELILVLGLFAVAGLSLHFAASSASPNLLVTVRAGYLVALLKAVAMFFRRSARRQEIAAGADFVEKISDKVLKDKTYAKLALSCLAPDQTGIVERFLHKIKEVHRARKNAA